MIRSIAAQNASLDNDYGPTRGPNAANSHDLALLDEDGVELDDATSPGYARVTILPADWPAAVEGAKSASVTLPPAEGEWVDAASFVLIGDDGHEWDSADLQDPLLITGAGDGPQVAVTVFYTQPLEG